MSEYQYYEFQAIDRRLTAHEMAKLRYEDAWMDKYFDAFLYLAN